MLIIFTLGSFRTKKRGGGKNWKWDRQATFYGSETFFPRLCQSLGKKVEWGCMEDIILMWVHRSHFISSGMWKSHSGRNPDGSGKNGHGHRFWHDDIFGPICVSMFFTVTVFVDFQSFVRNENGVFICNEMVTVTIFIFSFFYVFVRNAPKKMYFFN